MNRWRSGPSGCSADVCPMLGSRSKRSRLHEFTVCLESALTSRFFQARQARCFNLSHALDGHPEARREVGEAAWGVCERAGLEDGSLALVERCEEPRKSPRAHGPNHASELVEGTGRSTDSSRDSLFD